MKQQIRWLFSPILKMFESGSEPFDYKSSHRYILIFMGFLFSALATVLVWFSKKDDLAYLIPVLVFAAVGLVSFLVGLIGTDRAVAKIWGTRK